MKATLTQINSPEKTVVFEVPPQKVVRSFKTEYNKLAVLKTAQPLLSYQHSGSTVTLPGLLLFNDKVGDDLRQLEEWTKPDTSTEPPALKFEFTHLKLERCRIESAEVTEDMWVGGNQPTRAEVTLTLILDPIPPEPKKVEVNTDVKLSPLEKEKYLAQILTKVKANPKKYSYKPTSKLDITSDNKVILDGKDIGKLEDFITLPKKHTVPEGKPKPQLPKSESSSVSASKTSK